MSFTKTTIIEDGAADDHPDGHAWVWTGEDRSACGRKVGFHAVLPPEARPRGMGEGGRGRFEITVKFTPEGSS